MFFSGSSWIHKSFQQRIGLFRTKHGQDTIDSIGTQTTMASVMTWHGLNILRIVEVSKAWPLLRTACLPIIKKFSGQRKLQASQKICKSWTRLVSGTYGARIVAEMLLSWQHLNSSRTNERMRMMWNFRPPIWRPWSYLLGALSLCCSMDLNGFFRCRCQPFPWRRHVAVIWFANQGRGDSESHRSVQEAVGQQWPEHLNRQEWDVETLKMCRVWVKVSMIL